MGTLRTLLAISVLITHSSPIFGITLLGGDTAVTCFFIISGFLITLILHEKYQDLRAFYVNRGLRIYVPYWSALLLSIVLFLFITRTAHDPDRAYLAALDAGAYPALAWATVSNLSLVGIDLTRYIAFDPNLGIVFPNFLQSLPTEGHSLLFVPQAWTLAIELQFYIVAPLLVRLRVPLLLALTVGFLLMRAIVFGHIRAQGMPLDDLSIFPMTLGYFLLGALAYHAFRWWRRVGVREPAKRAISAAAWLFGIALVFTGLLILRPLPREAYDLFYVAMAVVLPFAFYLTKDWRWDSKVGDYSYPIYVFHFVISALVVAVGVSSSVGLWVLLVTVAVSTVFLRYIDAPVQKVRRRIAARGSRQPVPRSKPATA